MSATTSAPQPAPTSPLRGLAMRHPLVSFFALAYAFTWIAWSPWYLSESGVGLSSMRERAVELGGSFEIEAVPAGGTRVRASLPCTLEGEG